MACFTPEQYRMASEGLLEAFPDWISVATMLTAVAETPKVKRYPRAPIAASLRNLNRIVPVQASMPEVVYKVLQAIEASDLCRELVKTAHEWRPTNANLEELNRQLMPLKTADPRQEDQLETLLTITKEQFGDPLLFAQRFGPIRYRVCRIEKGRKDAASRQPQATGFLVQSDVVLTNHHVIAPVLNGDQDPRDFVCGFDRVEVDGVETSGPTYGLNTPTQRDGWLLATSETAALDYALLRLDARAGDQPIVSSTGEVAGEKRGWLSLSADGSRELKKEAPLWIFQHPNGMALRYDIRAVDTLSETRVTYTTNTMKGSSGSPCFDTKLRLSALHRGFEGALNQGVPVAAILADLEKQNLKGKVAVE